MADSPARAGMDPTIESTDQDGTSFPRTRGDGPWKKEVVGAIAGLPPHARGWTSSLFGPLADDRASPARAGMDRSSV